MFDHLRCLHDIQGKIIVVAHTIFGVSQALRFDPLFLIGACVQQAALEYPL